MVGRPPKYIFWFSLRFRPVAEPWDVATMFSSALVLMSTTVTVAGLKKTDQLSTKHLYSNTYFTPGSPGLLFLCLYFVSCFWPWWWISSFRHCGDWSIWHCQPLSPGQSSLSPCPLTAPETRSPSVDRKITNLYLYIQYIYICVTDMFKYSHRHYAPYLQWPNTWAEPQRRRCGT